MQEEWNAEAGEVVPDVPVGSPIHGVAVQVVDAAGEVLERHVVVPPA